MNDSSSFTREYLLAERRRRSVVTGFLIGCLFLALLVCAAYAKTLIERPHIVVRAPSVGFCAGHQYHQDCVAVIEVEKRQYLEHLKDRHGHVQLEADRPSIMFEKLPEYPEGEAEICRMPVALYKGRIVILGLRESEGAKECGPLPSSRPR